MDYLPLSRGQCPQCGRHDSTVVAEWWEGFYRKVRFQCNFCDRKWTITDD